MKTAIGKVGAIYNAQDIKNPPEKRQYISRKRPTVNSKKPKGAGSRSNHRTEVEEEEGSESEASEEGGSRILKKKGNRVSREITITHRHDTSHVLSSMDPFFSNYTSEIEASNQQKLHNLKPKPAAVYETDLSQQYTPSSYSSSQSSVIPTELQIYSPVFNTLTSVEDKKAKHKKKIKDQILGYKDQCAMFTKLLDYHPKETEEHKKYLQKLTECADEHYFWFQKLAQMEKEEILMDSSPPNNHNSSSTSSLSSGVNNSLLSTSTTTSTALHEENYVHSTEHQQIFV